MKLLLVDDDAFLRDMYATKFTEAGDDVVVAASGKEAVTLLGQGTFDAVVTDMVMPGLTGPELIRAISAAGTKCVVLSNQGEDSDIAAAKAAGAVGYLVKANLIPSEVVTSVHNLLK